MSVADCDVGRPARSGPAFQVMKPVPIAPELTADLCPGFLVDCLAVCPTTGRGAHMMQKPRWAVLPQRATQSPTRRIAYTYVSCAAVRAICSAANKAD